jgi:hypothetical protein
MAFASPITHCDVVTPVVTPHPRPRGKVIALRAPRVWLEVVLTANTADSARANLAALLHSPLGVYVAQTTIVRGATCVQLDIAPEDFAFTLHTLMSIVPQATIGTLCPRTARKEA